MRIIETLYNVKEFFYKLPKLPDKESLTHHQKMSLRTGACLERLWRRVLNNPGIDGRYP